MRTDQPTPALSLNEAAAIVGVSAQTIRKEIRLGNLPAFRIGRQIRIRPEALDAFMEAGR